MEPRTQSLDRPRSHFHRLCGRAGALLSLLIALLAGAAPAATLIGPVQTPRYNRLQTNITFRPIGTPFGLGGTSLVASVLVTTNLNTNGEFTVTVAPGPYEVSLGRLPMDRFNIVVPDDTNTYALGALVTNSVAWTNFFSASTAYGRTLMLATNAEHAVELLGGATSGISASTATNITTAALSNNPTLGGFFVPSPSIASWGDYGFIWYDESDDSLIFSNLFHATLFKLDALNSPFSVVRRTDVTNIVQAIATGEVSTAELNAASNAVLTASTVTTKAEGALSTNHTHAISNLLAALTKAEGALSTNHTHSVSNALAGLIGSGGFDTNDALVHNLIVANNLTVLGTNAADELAAGNLTVSNLTAGGVAYVDADGFLTNTAAGTTGQIPTKRADGTWGVSNAVGEVSAAQLNTTSNAVLVEARDRADTDLLFYDSFTQTNWFGKTNWISDSGHYVRIMQPLNGTATAADPYESGYMTNGWLGLNASSNDSTFYLMVTLTNYVRTDPIELGIEWRYVEAGSGSNWSALDNESMTIANVGGDHPNWRPMVHMKFLQECTYFYASTWTNGGSGTPSLLPTGFPTIPFNTRLRAELTSPVPHQSSVIFWGDNSVTATMDGFSTNLWYYNLDEQTGTNFYFQLWQDNYASARRWIEFNRIWIKKVVDRRIPSFAGRYGPGITNAEGIAALALDAGSNVALTTNGNRIRIDTTGELNNWSLYSTSMVSGTAQTIADVASNSLYTVSSNISLVLATANTNHAAAILQASTNYANAVTNTSIARTNGTEFIRTNLITAAGTGIVIRQDGSGGVSISNAVTTSMTNSEGTAVFGAVYATNGFFTNLSVTTQNAGTLLLDEPLNSTSVSNATASRMAMFGPDKLLTNSAYSENDFARTNGTDMLRTNKITGSGIISIAQDGSGGVVVGASASAGSITVSNTGVFVTNAATILDFRAGTNMVIKTTNLDSGSIVIDFNAAGSTGGGSTQMVTAAIGDLTVTNKLGIGTNAPQSPLHIVGDNSGYPLVQVGTTNNNKVFNVYTNGAAFGTNNPVANYEFFASDAMMNNSLGYLFRVTAGQLNVAGAGGTNTFLIKTNGSVGIGKDPQVKLDVNGGINASAGSVNVVSASYSLGLQSKASLQSPEAGVLSIVKYTENGNGVGLIIGTNNIAGAAAWTAPQLRRINELGTEKAHLSIRSATNNAGADLSVWGDIYTSNSVVFTPIATGPANATNGLSAIWNSNGVATYIRSGPVGYTTNKDVLLILH